MSSFAFPFDAGFGEGEAAAATTSAVGEALGEDILLRDELEIGPAGDYTIVSGIAAYAQALRVRLLSEPGEDILTPAFGAGLGSLVFDLSDEAAVGRIKETVREQCLLDPRTDDVQDVIVQTHIDAQGQRVGLVLAQVTAIGVRLQVLPLLRVVP